MALAAGPVLAAPSAQSCEGLKALSLPQVTIDSATRVAAGEFVDENMDWLPPAQVPEHCRVQGTIRPSSDSDIKFEVWMPASGWNGKLQGVGNGGYAGTINRGGGLVQAVQRGYAGVSTNTGHAGTDAQTDWAKNHPEKLIDFAHRAVHLMTVNAKSIVKAYYGAAPKRSYFAACSNGGRQALMSAQRYPEDYDGIIAGAPANDWTGLMSGFIWNTQAQLASHGSYIPASKSAAIQAAVIKQCDQLDGVPDGIVAAPRACNFDPRQMLCKAKPDDSCLTRPQVETLTRIYRGPHTSAGVQLFPGFTPGAEVGVLPGSGWDGWVFGDAAGNSMQAHFARNTMRSIFTGNDRWEFGRFNFDRDTAPLTAKYAPILSATNPNLSRFVDRGGKLILFHGWADAAIPPLNTIKYYDSVVSKLGVQKSASAVRLFMVPGLQHCFPGAGPWNFGGLSAAAQPADPSKDLSAALERWVEQGVAPQSVRAVAPKDLFAGLFNPLTNDVTSSGLVCAWPKRARWNGFGNVDAAASYTCSDSTTPQLTRADLENWLDGLLPYALKKNDIAGMVVMVVKDGEVLLQKGYGYADVKANVPMDPKRSMVEVASVSKTFTWTAVMQLVEQGKLDLDRDINDYLDFKIPPAFGQAITMRHLMTHTPGFEERIKTYMAKDSPRALGPYLRTVPAPARIYPPGVVQAYSNYGVVLAGYIVERISGEAFATYVDRHILAPLGMQHSTMLRPIPKRFQPDLAKNYGLASEEPIPPSEVDELVVDPAGSLVSTADDMSRFMRAHLQKGTFAGYQLLKPETVELMHAPAFTPMPGAQNTALGFFGGDYNGHRIILHDGDGSGNHADMQLLIDDGVGFLAVMNSDGPGGFLGASYALRASLFHQFMDRYFPAPPDPQEPTAATAQEHARLAGGEYEMSRRATNDFVAAFYMAARIAIKANDDGTIETPAFLNFEHGRPQVWREVGPFTWREVGGKARLNMKVEEGRVKTWLPRDASTFQLMRVPYLTSRALNVPLAIASVVVVILAAVLWPAAAIVRRRYGRALDLEGRELRAYRYTRFAIIAAVLFLSGWIAVMMAVASGIASFNQALDPWIRVVHLIGLACVVGAGVAVWNAYVTCTGRRGLWVKMGSVLLALALVDLVWFSFAFGLISAGLNY